MRKKGKNYLPTLGLILILWSLWGWLITQVDPKLVKDILVPGLYLPFFLVFTPAVFFSLAIILADTKKGLLVSLGISGFLVLRIYGLGNIFNGLLIAGIGIAVDRYWSS